MSIEVPRLDGNLLVTRMFWYWYDGLVVSHRHTVILHPATQFRVEIPRGVRSDLASVPNPLWGVLDATPVQLAPMGFGHDYSVREGATYSIDGVGHRSHPQSQHSLL